MKKKNIFWIIAAAINLFTAIVHLMGGQLTLVNPLLKSDLSNQQQAEWVGVWHMVTIFLFITSYYLMKAGLRNNSDTSLIRPIGSLYILIGIPFIVASFWFQTFAPQWILILPIGIFSLLGLRNGLNRRLDLTT